MRHSFGQNVVSRMNSVSTATNGADAMLRQAVWSADVVVMTFIQLSNG